MRDSFVFYRSFAEALKALPEEEKNKAIDYIIAYALDDEEPEELEGIAVAVFKLVKPQIDANNKRFENGCKGGAPTGNQNARKQPKNNLETTKKQPKNNQKQPNVNVNDNDNVNVLYNTRRKWGGIQTGYDFQQLEREAGIK